MCQESSQVFERDLSKAIGRGRFRFSSLGNQGVLGSSFPVQTNFPLMHHSFERDKARSEINNDEFVIKNFKGEPCSKGYAKLCFSSEKKCVDSRILEYCYPSKK